MYWLILIVAIIANVIANVAFKKGVVGASQHGSLILLFVEPWFWIGVFGGAVLLTSYLLALTKIQLDIAYAIVTTSSLLLLTILSPHLFGSEVTMLKVLGMLFAVTAIGLLTYSQ